MPFPIEFDLAKADERGLVVVDNSDLRDRIMPIFEGDRSEPNARWSGVGTCFRVDPFGTCATAFHVIEDLLTPANDGTSIAVKSDCFLVALEMPGIIFGTIAIPHEWWQPINNISSIVTAVEQPPLQSTRIRNVSELSSSVLPSLSAGKQTPYLMTHLSSFPKVGDRVMAVGYADLDVDHEGRGEARPLEQKIYASVGVIRDVVAANGSSSQPWPKIRVDADWPGGMSGGPVFDESGFVIGLVSTSIAGLLGTATWFGGWDVPKRQFCHLDPCNAGWFFGYTVLDVDGNALWFGPELSKAKRFASRATGSEVRRVSYDPVTKEHMSQSATGIDC